MSAGQRISQSAELSGQSEAEQGRCTEKEEGTGTCLEQYGGGVSPPARRALIILQKDGLSAKGSSLTRLSCRPPVTENDRWRRREKGREMGDEERREGEREEERGKEGESNPLLPSHHDWST